MAEASANATTSVLPIPEHGSSEMAIDDNQDVIKTGDVPIHDDVSDGIQKDDERQVPHVESETNRSTQNGIDHQAGLEARVSAAPADQGPDDAGVAQAQTDDVEMEGTSADNPDRDTTRNTMAPPTNGTPASSKRAANAGSSKKKTAVPEHKSKKPNRRKSRPMTNLDASPGDYYFARMKGHAPWPSVICDEEMLPQNILSSRPVTARLPDGTFKKEEYADGGKRAHERTMPVMFLGTNEFAWMPNTDLTLIDIEEESNKEPSEKGRSKALLAAYAKLVEKRDLAHFKTMLLDHQKALAEDLAAQEAAAAEKESKKSKKSRKISEALDDDADIGGDPGTENMKAKKRKKAADDSDMGDKSEKPTKTPKTNQKFKLTTPKTPAESSKKKSTKPKSKDTKRKSSGDDSEDSASKGAKVPMTPEQILEHKERQIMYRRHKLQRGLLVKPPAVPKEEEMKAMSDFLREVAEYPHLEANILRSTKIHKVLKNIIKLDPKIIPNEDHFKFQQRSKELLAIWTATLEKDGKGDDDATEPSEAKKGEDKAKAGGPTSGPAALTNGKAIPDDADKSVAPEVSQEEVERKVGTSIEGAKQAEDSTMGKQAQAQQKTVAEETSDGPAVDTAPAAEFKPDDEA